MPGIPGGQKALALQELELWVAVGYHVAAGRESAHVVRGHPYGAALASSLHTGPRDPRKH